MKSKKILRWYLVLLVALGVGGFFYGFAPFWCVLALPLILVAITIVILVAALVIALICYTPIIIYTKLVLNGTIKRNNKSYS